MKCNGTHYILVIEYSSQADSLLMLIILQIIECPNRTDKLDPPFLKEID